MKSCAHGFSPEKVWTNCQPWQADHYFKLSDFDMTSCDPYCTGNPVNRCGLYSARQYAMHHAPFPGIIHQSSMAKQENQARGPATIHTDSLHWSSTNIWLQALSSNLWRVSFGSRFWHGCRMCHLCVLLRPVMNKNFANSTTDDISL